MQEPGDRSQETGVRRQKPEPEERRILGGIPVDSRRSPTVRLLAGLAITLSAVAVYSGYAIVQLRSLQEFQARTADRNRTDSLLLLRIQNSLN